MQCTQHIRLALGEVVGTTAAIDKLMAANVSMTDLLHRHSTGDWGDLGVMDIMMMDRNAVEDGWVMSAYKIPPDNIKIHIMTEWDRSVTTVMLASECGEPGPTKTSKEELMPSVQPCTIRYPRLVSRVDAAC